MIKLETQQVKTEPIPLATPCLAGNEWAYVKDCLDTGWVSTAGAYVDQFEQKICEYTGGQYAIACINGTAALHIALLAAGVKPGDEVIVPTLTFIATVNTVRYVNAEPVFLGSDSYFTLDPQVVREFLDTRTEFENGTCINKRSGRKISALIPVHVLGNAVDLEPIWEVCIERNIQIIEDAAESLGTYYSSGSLAPAHTGTLGRLGVYSFNGNKIITCGGGGMIVTDDPELASAARYLTSQAKDCPDRYIHNQVGYNYRLTNLQAAVGLAQLEKLTDFIHIKRNHYRIYKEQIDQIPGLQIAPQPDFAWNNSWMAALLVDESIYGVNAIRLMEILADRHIQTRPLWRPNHLQKPYLACEVFGVEASVQSWQQALNLPCSVSLTAEQRQTVIDVLKDAKR